MSNLKWTEYREPRSPYKSSRYTGVKATLNKQRPWHAEICFAGKRIPLGRHPSETEAAVAYDIAAKTLRGSKAVLNLSATERCSPELLADVFERITPLWEGRAL